MQLIGDRTSMCGEYLIHLKSPKLPQKYENFFDYAQFWHKKDCAPSRERNLLPNLYEENLLTLRPL